MLRMNKKERSLANRTAARARMDEVRALAVRMIERDNFGGHVTVWATEGGGAVQWYPGTSKWTPPGGQEPTIEGGFDAFTAWLKNERDGYHTPRRAPDDFELIDMEDVW